MLGLLVVATLAAGPQYVEPWGLSLVAKDDALVIDAVRPGSLAEKAHLPVGAVLLRLVAPARPGALGTLDGAALAEVRAELAETKAERVGLQLLVDGTSRAATLDRNPFVPKKAEELRAMTPMESARYYAQLGQGMRPRSVSASSRADFGDARTDREAFVDPTSHRLLGVPGGGATGAWVFVSAELHYGCTSPAVAATVSGPGLPAPVRVDLASQRLHGGQLRVLVPAATLAAVEACPREPLSQRLDLEVQCSEGPKVLGREKVRLSVRCQAPKDFVMPPFSRQEPLVHEATVAEGTASFLVRPFLERDGPVPRSVDVLVLDEQGAKASALPAAWRGDGAATTDEWKEVRVPAPAKPGRYQVVFEASWADGSTSRSATTPLAVLSKADAAQRDRDFDEGLKNFSAVQARMKRAGIDPCSGTVAMAWLKKQPEVASVTPNPSGDYSWQVHKGVSPVSVHCHGSGGGY